MILKGHVEVDNGVRVQLPRDFGKLYQWLIARKLPWIRTQLPAHGIHSTLCNPKIHKVSDFSPVQAYHGQEVEVDCSPWIIQSPKNFWLPAKCLIYHEIKWLLGFEETPNWWGLHVVVCNMKFEKRPTPR